ncbi:hypothetical protein EVAR_21742_1 [Eumeta japonica]|uniref:Integrase catalytic domain-containing protein n=1 Tax=Eumeta variegata TaxID=151549 RepID=A0A4C1ZN87_EUMVA|nr:hypothetical protein EVAR_21742_1 [Eumeta japonica]
MSLHVFSDASLKAYATCVYVRSADALGNITVRLLCAKAKVKPLKAITIPRMELCGALLAARLYDKVKKASRITIDQVHFWCDSKIVLGWLKISPHKLSAFISHRVTEINNLCDSKNWMYVPSSWNPADLASRGVYPDELQSLCLWWEGPSYLKDTQDKWPEQHSDTQTNLPELRVKAVHLELVTDLSTETFILALRRFMSRRGKPREIYCDNGTNFVGANRAIRDLASVSDFVDEGINFHHAPAYSPHFGGLYESVVTSAKFHMKRVLGNTHLTYEELSTLFVQIEAILNSRPLVPMSPDPNDFSPLTPGHFLIGRPLTSLPSPDLQDANPSRLHRYARIEQARQHFWTRWSREYVCELQQRPKWQHKQPDIKPDQMVLIRDDSTPMKWPLGRVTVVYPGSDGASRVAEIKTSKGVVLRAINKICPLLNN